jgi:hypothetical protein
MPPTALLPRKEQHQSSQVCLQNGWITIPRLPSVPLRYQNHSPMDMRPSLVVRRLQVLQEQSLLHQYPKGLRHPQCPRSKANFSLLTPSPLSSSHCQWPLTISIPTLTRTSSHQDVPCRQFKQRMDCLWKDHASAVIHAPVLLVQPILTIEPPWIM